MTTIGLQDGAKCMNLITFIAKDDESAQLLLAIFAQKFRPPPQQEKKDVVEHKEEKEEVAERAPVLVGPAMFKCGFKDGSTTEIVVCELWNSWEEGLAFFQESVLPDLDKMNALMVENLDPSKAVTSVNLM